MVEWETTASANPARLPFDGGTFQKTHLTSTESETNRITSELCLRRKPFPDRIN